MALVSVRKVRLGTMHRSDPWVGATCYVLLDTWQSSRHNTHMARVTLSVPAGYNRADQPCHLDRSVVDEIEFDADQMSFAEALGDAGYLELVIANWIYESESELRCVVDRRVIWIAEVDLGSKAAA